MRYFVEARLDIALDDPGVAVKSRYAAPGYSMVRTPIGPKPVGVIMELDLKDGLQRHSYRLLDNFVPQTGDSKLAHFAICLGNFHPP